MEIHGDLIQLEHKGYLPLPWTVRAHLGLANGTHVQLALTKPKPGLRRVPDILLTPLQTQRLNETLCVELEVDEREGAVAAVLSKFSKNVNIVLSDSITLEGRQKHKISVIVEPAKTGTTYSQFRKEISRNLDIDNWPTRLKLPNITRVYDGPSNFLREYDATVRNGFVKTAEWRKEIEREYPDDVAYFDLSRLVVSSNPDQRLLRYVIPRKGVVQVTVPHRNIPHAVKEISRTIRDNDYNILSSRLSRTPPHGALEGNISEFVAVCEPVKEAADPRRLKASILDGDNILTGFGISRVKTTTGRWAENTTYIAPLNSRFVSPGEKMALLNKRCRQQIISEYLSSFGKPPHLLVFVSRRFVQTRSRARLILEEYEHSLAEIRTAILDASCAVVEADIKSGQDTTPDAVYPRLWSSDACLVLALDELGHGALSPSQMHEYGFFMGQTKPVKALVEKTRQGQLNVGNIDGYTRLEYAGGAQLQKRTSSQSLYAAVTRFMNNLFEHYSIGRDPE